MIRVQLYLFGHRYHFTASRLVRAANRARA